MSSGWTGTIRKFPISLFLELIHFTTSRFCYRHNRHIMYIVTSTRAYDRLFHNCGMDIRILGYIRLCGSDPFLYKTVVA